MNQLTVKEALPEIAAVSGVSGMSVTDPRVLGRLNAAIRELMNTGDYPSVVDRWLFRADQATGLVALPYMFDRLMQVTVDHIPGQIVSPWFEFYNYGPGINDDYDACGNVRRCWTDVVMDRGDSPTTWPIPDAVNVPTGPWTLRVYATVDETAGAELNIQGFDTDGLLIRSQPDGTAGDWINGVNFSIDNNEPFTTSAQEFSKINSVSKPETNGYVRVTAWNGTDEVELSNYAWNETTPSYRHYYIPAIHNRGYSGYREKIIMARCRKRYIPAKQDDDLLIIGNIEALREMAIAQWKRLTDNESYLVHRQTAIEIMRQEAEAYLGKSRIPAISMQRGFAIGALPFIR